MLQILFSSIYRCNIGRQVVRGPRKTPEEKRPKCSYYSYRPSSSCAYRSRGDSKLVNPYLYILYSNLDIEHSWASIIMQILSNSRLTMPFFYTWICNNMCVANVDIAWVPKTSVINTGRTTDYIYPSAPSRPTPLPVLDSFNNMHLYKRIWIHTMICSMQEISDDSTHMPFT
jgi:hypothetical protein